MPGLGTGILAAIIVIIVLIVVAIGVVSMWKKVPQDKALVVTGLKKRVISGGGGLVIPLLERTDLISLENMQIPVSVNGLTSTGVEIQVGALTILKIKNVTESILSAMEQFNTGKVDGTIQNIENTTREVLEGKLREIVSGMSVEEIYQNREKFASSVQDVAAQELQDMGLEIKAFTIKEITDNQGYIASLGKKQVAEVKKDAAIAESEAKKIQEITVASNEKETAIKKAEIQRETTIQLADNRQKEETAKAIAEIEIANKEREKELNQLQNKEETEVRRAKADSAYKIEENKMLKDIIVTEKEAKVIAEQKNIELTKAQLEVEKTREIENTEVAKQKSLRVKEELDSTIQREADANAAK